MYLNLNINVNVKCYIITSLEGMHLLRKKIKAKIREAEGSNLYALLGYIILTLILTYPAILKMGTHLIGTDHLIVCGGAHVISDAPFWQGVLWWFDKAIIELGTNPLYSNYFLYPVGMTMFVAAIIGILLVPITHVFGTIVSYNIYVLSTFVLAGFGTYLLVKYLTENTKASFIAGIVYAFCPYHFAQVLGGDIHIASIQWIPFYLLFLMKMVKEKKRFDACLCAIFFSLTALSSWTLAVYAAIFSIMYIIYILYTNRDAIMSYNFIKEFAVFGIVSAALITPFALVLVNNMLTNPSMHKPLSNFVFYSADLLGFFIPGPDHTIFGNYVMPIYYNFTGNAAENTTYVGYTVLILVLFTIWRIRAKKIRFFAISALIFFILSLGPVLHINGIFTIPVSGLNIDDFVRSIGIQLPPGAFDILSSNIVIPLPGLALYYLPILSMGRCPGRFDVMIMLMLAILIGFGVSEILKRVKDNNKKQLVCILIGSLIIFEFLAIPLPMSSTNAPDFYYQISDDSDDYALVELPLGASSPTAPHTASRYLYCFYLSIHGKKFTGGGGSRESVPFYAFVRRILVLQKFEQFNITEDDILNQRLSLIGQSVLNYYDFRYVILHYNFLKNEYKDNAETILAQIFGNESYYKEGEMVVYEVKKNNLAPFMMLGNNWHEVEIWQGSPFRLMSNNATIQIINPTNETIEAKLKFVVTSIYQPGTLNLYINNKQIESYNIGVIHPNKTNISTPTITIRPGSNIVKLYTPEGVVVHGDSREVSMGFQNVRLVKVDQ